ncbi:energy transducer TonB, partial [Azohydromonas lata]
KRQIQRPAPQAPAITSVPVAPPPAPPAPPAPPPEAPPAPVQRTAPVINFSGCAKPDYNAAARRAEAQGSTVISFLIDTDGRVLESRVDRSSGATREHKMLDRLAVDALAQCRFKPGTVNGQPERSWSRVEYVWKLVD